jgi:DNA-binding phage protein
MARERIAEARVHHARGNSPGLFRHCAQNRNIHTIADMRVLDDKDVVRLLRSEVERAGGQSAWARREGIDRTLLNRVLNGQEPPTREIIRALKLCNAYTFRDEIRQLRWSAV